MSKGSTTTDRGRALRRARRELRLSRRRATYRLHDRLLTNRSSRRALRRTDTELTEAQRAAVDRLATDGIAVMPFDELIGDRALWEELAADMDRFTADAEGQLASGGEDAGADPQDGSGKIKKTFLIRRNRRLPKHRSLDAADDSHGPWKFTPDYLWLRLGLSDGMLGVVNAYRQLQTRLISFDQWYTVPVGADSGRIKSQNWHRDPEDLHVVKGFVYFSDVDEESGPFQYVPGSQPGGRHGDVWPWTFARGGDYPSAKKFAKRIPETEHLTVTGRRGTVILCNTSGFHRGGFALTRPRIMSVYTYVSPAALAVGTCWPHFDVDWSSGAALPDHARFALERG